MKLEGNTCRGEYARLERLRKEANDHAKFHNIGREIYIQSLIVTVPAWKEILAQAAEGIVEVRQNWKIITDIEELRQRYDSRRGKLRVALSLEY